MAPAGQCHKNTGRERWILVDQVSDSIPSAGLAAGTGPPRLEVSLLTVITSSLLSASHVRLVLVRESCAVSALALKNPKC